VLVSRGIRRISGEECYKIRRERGKYEEKGIN
jgi:hypothetical protein